MNRKNVAEVILLKINAKKGFHYLIPSEMLKIADIGKRVQVPFRNKKMIGIIREIFSETNVKNLKEIDEIIDHFPILSPEIFRLVDWISKYYLCPIGTIITHIIPTQASRKKIDSYLEITDKVKDNTLKKYQQQLLKFESTLSKYKEDILKKPILFHYKSYQVRDRYYELCIKKTLQKGKQVLLLIPDQHCCVQLKKSINKKYGDESGIFDKKVNQTQKYLRFLQVARGDIKIVIGTRSNIFLPFQNLGLVIVEQENSLLYKEERVPRYNAREVALKRGQSGLFQVILGSFAPSVESYWNFQNQKSILKSEKPFLNTCINYPKIEIVDMEEEKSFQRIISFQLQQRIIQCLKKGKKVILFHNRRGFAGYLICSQCGHVLRCPECGHLLTFHVEGDTKYAICHSCGKKVKMEKYCPECGNGEIKPVGFGTQHVEIFVKRMFPRAIVQRLDIDIAPRIVTQRKIINNFNRGKIDILIGTQLIFRELDFQNVGLLGMILADSLLNLPDYKSAELSFQYIYQLALNLTTKEEAKTLMIQTFQAEHHSLEAIEKMDYGLFYKSEMMTREELHYPPLDKMIKIEFISRKREKVQKSAFEFINYMHESDLMSKYDLDLQLNRENLVVLREKDKHKVNYILKIDTQKQDIDYLKGILFDYISKFKSNDVKLVIDIDPVRIN
jgi:primosomal protein N' (replication factor Y) (superfamily II helicase)